MSTLSKKNYNEKNYIFLLSGLILCVFCFPTSRGVIKTTVQNETLCGDSDVRRSSALQRVALCTVIEGNLLIAMTLLPSNASFPHLREITGFLVIYDLAGLDGLAHLFPNLAVIRGQSLISNFALVIRSTSLKTIGLPSLRVIQRGGVRVDLNTNLCYVRTINWSYILGNQTTAAAPVRLLSNRLICPDACQSQCTNPYGNELVTGNGTLNRERNSQHGHCWSASHCQSICSPSCTSQNLACEVHDVYRCCDIECLGGCHGPGPGACVACKGALHRGRCVPHCPAGTYLFHGRRCVTTSECFNMSSSSSGVRRNPPFQSNANNIPTLPTGNAFTSIPPSQRFAIHQGRCIADCPSGHQRDIMSGECLQCGDKCPRIYCQSALINSLKSLSKLKDCYSITDLYISIQEGDPTLISQQFDEAFSSLREVESIRVIRASALTSLAFLRHVRRINTNANRLPNETVLEIRGNDNLMELWPPPTTKNHSLGDTEGLHIVSEGLVHFILNRHLCPKKITDLIKSGALILPNGRNFRLEELELSEATNGKMGFCETTPIPLQLKLVASTFAVIHWPRIVNSHPTGQAVSPLVLVFYQPTPKNLSVHSSRVSCIDDSWRMIPSGCNTSMVGNESFCSQTLDQLNPATRYAVYVESKRLFSQRGAISSIVYFTTTPSNPSPPRIEGMQALGESQISVTWLPPQRSNGRLAAYVLWFRTIQIYPEPYHHRNFCFATPDWLTSAITPSYPDEFSRLTGTFWSYTSSKPGLLSKEECPPLRSQDGFWMVDSQDAALPVVFYNRVSRMLEDGEVGLVIVNADSGSEALESTIGSHQLTKRKMYTHTLTNLQAFSQYIVELQACQLPDKTSDYLWRNLSNNHSLPAFKLTPDLRDYLSHYCSSRVFRTQRTLPAIGADNVNPSSLTSEPHDSSGTVYVSWKEPPSPNGVILYYILRYRRVVGAAAALNRQTTNEAGDSQANFTDAATSSASSGWSTLCVSRANWMSMGIPRALPRRRRSLANSVPSSDASPNMSVSSFASSALGDKSANLGGANLLNLLPGFYELQIMSVSLAGNSSWTPPLVFQVNSSPRDTIIMASANSLAVVSVILATIISCIIYRVRKKRLLDSEWHSFNPEYWHVYEVDDWEMQLGDIDALKFRHALGRGNFGMVYRGVVKTLRTPARCFYTEPFNLQAAIKTLSAASTVFDRRDFITEACYMKQFQNFHIVRLFGVVSKGSPSSAGGATKGGVRSPKSWRFSLREGLSALRRQSARRQAIPIPVNKRLPDSSLEETTLTNGPSTTATSPTTVGVAETSGDIATSDRDAAESLVKREPSRYVRIARGSFSRLLKNPKNRHCISDATGLLSSTAPPCSSTDSMKLFSQFGLFVVMELMENGDLASYLRKLGDQGCGFVKPTQAYLWAVQIADGMAYLEKKKYVHRDLAARNCLVDCRGVVKIGDFGLCRDIYERNYYHKVGAGKLPVRWMAPESLQSAYFTSRSDVWSFGVVLWEIATMACLPYQGMSHEEVIAYVLDRNTLLSGGAPINCPPLLQSTMLYCWSYRPEKRPSFLHLLYLLAPRFADADFRQASYFYVGDALTQQPPPCQDLENSFQSKSSSSSIVSFSDLPNLIRTVLGPSQTCFNNGSVSSLSEESPQVISNLYSPSPHQESQKTEPHPVPTFDPCSFNECDAALC